MLLAFELYYHGGSCHGSLAKKNKTYTKVIRFLKRDLVLAEKILERGSLCHRFSDGHCLTFSIRRLEDGYEAAYVRRHSLGIMGYDRVLKQLIDAEREEAADA